MWFRKSRTPIEEGDSGRALRDAKENLERVKSRDEDVKDVAGALRNWREENHFRERLQELFLIGHQGGGS